MENNFQNLIDFQKISALLEGFYKSTNFAAAITDLDGKIIAKSGDCEICDKFHRKNLESLKRCKISDSVIANKNNNGEKYHLYKCLNGLFDISIPIIIDGKHRANLITGQFFLNVPDIDYFKSQANNFGIDEPSYLNALNKVPIVDEDKVFNTLNFLKTLIELIIENVSQKVNQFKEFFESDITGDYIATAEGKIVTCNSAFCKILGYDRTEDLIGKNITDFYENIDDRNGLIQLINEKKVLRNYQTKLKRKDGQCIISNENIVGQFDTNGNFMHYFGYLYDVTEQIKNKEDLLIKNQLLTSVVETQNELIARYKPDTTLTFVNNAYCSFFGINENELIGQKFLQFVPESDHALELSRIASLNKQEPTLKSLSQSVKKDGSTHTIEWTDTAIFNEKFEVVEIQSFGVDVTEKLNSDKELFFLIKMNELLRKIATDYIRIPHHDINLFINKSLEEIGKFIKADRVYIFKYNWNQKTCSNTFEWCEKSIEPQIDYLQDVPLSEIPQWWKPHKKGKTLVIEDVKGLNENDMVRQILEVQNIKSLITIPIMDDNYCVGFVGLDYVKEKYSPTLKEKEVLFVFAEVLVNIQKRAKLEKELLLAKEKAEESDKLKTAFINNISHELRTPLNGILGAGQILVEPQSSIEERKEMLSLFSQSSDRLINTINDYMEMAKIASSTYLPKLQMFLLQEWFKGFVSPYKSMCNYRGLDFFVDIPSNSANIILQSDKEILQKVLNKILENAIKFTLKGNITCGYFLESNQVQFYVKDTGIGIKEEMLQQIFEIFKQEDTSNTRGYEGSGLGLSIAQGLVKLIGDDLTVISQKGAGSTFSFTIPIVLTENTVKNNFTESNKNTTNQAPSILIVEDDLINYKILSYILKTVGIEHLHAKNGVEAVEICQQNFNIQLVLMDIKMPVMNGMVATKTIKSFRPELPIIATTANFQTDSEYYFKKNGFNEFLPKPLKKESLLSKIQKYIKI